MEQKSEKTARRTRCFRLGKLGCFTLIVLMVGLIACVTFQFFTLISMERRLASVEMKLYEIAKERNNYSWSETETRGLPSSSRQKRNSDATTSLSDLTKRPIALEKRYSGEENIVYLVLQTLFCYRAIQHSTNPAVLFFRIRLLKQISIKCYK